MYHLLMSACAELYKIYQYDYMDLDRLYSEISAMGYKIVENNIKNEFL